MFAFQALAQLPIACSTVKHTASAQLPVTCSTVKHTASAQLPVTCSTVKHTASNGKLGEGLGTRLLFDNIVRMGTTKA